uniref:Uncharacterized protein n=1 Tax=Myoviridae sp. ctCo31 TaxID=2825053 RepID=A0A8S5UMT9_9CAUD|nr:MAG TPA: hypothetical protein [Myoviridae sp. ctCo31]
MEFCQTKIIPVQQKLLLILMYFVLKVVLLNS